MANIDFKGFGGCFVKEFPLVEGNLVLKQRWLSNFYSSEDVVTEQSQQINASPTQNTTASLLVMPGYVLITTQPELCGQLSGIAELQFRQDELKQDFSQAIAGLIAQVTGAQVTRAKIAGKQTTDPATLHTPPK